MKAGDELLGTVFSKGHRYVIPIFQRPYVWNEEENWLPLWNDIARATEEAEAEPSSTGPADDPPEYFLGALVTQHRRPSPRRVPTSMIIDGQQRLTTLQVFLAAARRACLKASATDAANQFQSLVINQVSADTEYPEDRHKLTPLPLDQPALAWALRGQPSDEPAPDSGHLLVKAAAFFDRALDDWLAEVPNVTNRLDYLYFAVANRIKVVSVFLDDRDDPQVIFEALNHRGVRLDAADLVKNLLFQTLERQGDHAHTDDLYKRYWKDLDGERWRQEITTGRIKRVRVDALLAYWLSVQRGEESSIEHLFNDIKRWLANSGSRAADVIKDIRRYADTMDRVQSEPLTSVVGQFVDRLEANRTTTPWPLLLLLHATSGISEDQARLGTAALDSFLMRRAICRQDTKDYNRFFGTIMGSVRDGEPARAGQTVVNTLLSQTAPTRSWPTDQEFRIALAVDDLYNPLYRARLKSLLVGLENRLLSAKTDEDEPRSAQLTTLSVEHVLPQEWRTNWPLDPDASDDAVVQREAHVHRLGNLTLTTGSLNSSLSNAPWSKKRLSLQTHSLLRISTGSVLAPPPNVSMSHNDWVAVWDERRINDRGAFLAGLALQTWPKPQQPADGQHDPT